MHKYIASTCIAACIFGINGCQTTNQTLDVESANLTVGTAQRSVKIGMAQDQVLSALGSPNMVSTDADRNEVWVYDRVSTNSMSRSSDGFVFGLIAGASTNNNQYSRTQQTLTIIIKFDKSGLVKDFSYHSSKF